MGYDDGSLAHLGGDFMVSIVILVVAAVGLAVAFHRLQVAQRERDALISERDRLRERVAILARYDGIADAEVHAAAIVATARQEAERIVAAAQAQHDNAARVAAETEARARDVLAAAVQEADRSTRLATSAAQREAERIVAGARVRHDESVRAATELRSNAERFLSEAGENARQIIGVANEKAQAIAGEALAALAKKDQIEKTIVAVRNALAGYGQRYLVPANDAIDDLAEGFSFMDAGQQLKAIRSRMRAMTESAVAGTCDYDEANRRETATRFVIDAFNGKVASILSEARDDNYGTLQQKLRDAFTLVNHNGEAFRNARITPEYLALRLEELRWAVAANELRQRARDEQRAINERIRDEERAQKEFERARKDAEKEELAIRKALEKAEKDLAKAGEEQKAKYEELIRQLGGRLQDAEERGQRAISMAQQTRAGTVYIISNVGSFGSDVVKIGLTRRLEPLERVRELGDASVPFGFDVHAFLKSDDAPTLETFLHRKFVRMQVNKANPRKEFFRISLAELRSEIETLGIASEWTMAAAAREYRETVAQEMRMAGDLAEAKRWEEEQERRFEASRRARGMADEEEEASAEGLVAVGSTA